MMLTWIPDGCRVRDKMLYSSSTQDLKRALGLGFFTSEYGANLLTDVRWESFQTFLRKDSNKDDLLSESERLVLEEKSQTRHESSKDKSTAMGVLPFSLAPGVKEEFEKFATLACNWVELSVISECIHSCGSKTLDSGDSLHSHINSTEAR